jgi:hypothetical protein
VEWGWRMVRCCWECGSCGAFTEREEILVEVVEVCLPARYKNEERKENCDTRARHHKNTFRGQIYRCKKTKHDEFKTKRPTRLPIIHKKGPYYCPINLLSHSYCLPTTHLSHLVGRNHLYFSVSVSAPNSLLLSQAR